MGTDVMLKGLLAAFFLGLSFTAASAVDVKDLAPCKPAASRYCDHLDMTASISNLLRCGATLASLRHRIGEPCREVLRRYGQL
jgi:hypothetical protein